MALDAPIVVIEKLQAERDAYFNSNKTQGRIRMELALRVDQLQEGHRK